MNGENTQFDICSGNNRIASIVFSEKTKTYIWRTRNQDLEKIRIKLEAYQSRSLPSIEQCLNDAMDWFRNRTGLNIEGFYLKPHIAPKPLPKIKNIDIEVIKSTVQTTELMIEVLEKQLINLKRYLQEAEKAS